MRSEAAFTIVEVLRGEWLVAWNMIETKLRGQTRKQKKYSTEDFQLSPFTEYVGTILSSFNFRESGVTGSVGSVAPIP